MLDLFAERVADYRATVTRCAATDSPRPSPRRSTAHRRSSCRPGSSSRCRGAVVDDDLTHADLDAVDAVVTAAAVGIAETGTVVLDHGPGQGRRRHHPAARPARLRRPRAPGRARRPRRPRPARPAAPADLDQRPLGHQRHRAQPRRGRARPAPPARDPGRRLAGPTHLWVETRALSGGGGSREEGWRAALVAGVGLMRSGRTAWTPTASARDRRHGSRAAGTNRRQGFTGAGRGDPECDPKFRGISVP